MRGDHGSTSELGPLKELYRNEEGIHVDVQDRGDRALLFLHVPIAPQTTDVHPRSPGRARRLPDALSDFLL